MIPEQPEERRALIGEYVLGLLESSDAAEIRELIESNQEAARMALEWEQHLLELSDELSEQTPSRALWLRIQRSLGHVQIEQMAVWRHWWDSAGLWRLTSGALALVVLLSWLSTSLEQDPALANESFTAVLQPPREAASPGWVVQVDMNGTLRLEALVDQPIPEDRSLQFWTLADPEQGPRSLGLIEPGGSVTLSADQIGVVQAGQLFELTLEPAGGSPLDRPTGEVLYIGRAVMTVGS